MRKKTSLFIGVMLTVLILYGCSKETTTEMKSILDSDEKVEWKLGHSAHNGDLVFAYAEKIKEEIEKAFEGKVEIKIFPSDQLGNYEEQIELLQANSLEFSVPAAPPLSSINDEIAFTSINFALDEDEELNEKAMKDGEAFKEINKKLIDNNIKPLNWFIEGTMHWSSDKPLEKVEDFKGLKIRTAPSSQIIANYEVLGASPTPIPFDEVYSALQLNTVVAQENPIDTIYSHKYYEVQDYITMSYHHSLVSSLATGTEFWNSLAQEDKDIIEDVINKTASFIVDTREESAKNALEEIKASGKTTIIELDPQERERIVEKSHPAEEEYFKIAGEDGKNILKLWAEDIEKAKE